MIEYGQDFLTAIWYLRYQIGFIVLMAAIGMWLDTLPEEN